MDDEKEEYMEKIVEMVKEIENIDWLRFIHRTFVRVNTNYIICILSNNAIIFY